MATLEAAEILVPSSPQEAIDAFGDGAGITVFGGGTILMPEIAYGRLKPSRALMLGRAGLAGIRREGGKIVVGATTTVAELEEAPEPLASSARWVGDYEIRAQATIGGNLCSGPATESPRGDLQASLIALAARVRSAGAGGERTDAVEDFLASGSNGRLVLALEFDEPARGSHASLRRPHAHAYTVLAVCCAETGGAVRVAVTGGGPGAIRARSVEEALAGGADPIAAADKVLDDVQPQDDALASAWYRRRMLPVLVRRALDELQRSVG